MLNYLWAAMLILGIVYGALQGRLPELTEAALESAGEAVTLCITMAGIMALWVGLMEIAQRSGVPGYRSFYEFHVSEAAQGASGAGIYHHQCDCQYLWAWLGSDAGGTEGHGSAQRSGRGTAAYRKSRAEKWDGK